MNTTYFGGKGYRLDSLGNLTDPMEWDENFAEGMAPTLGISDGLTDEHLKVIKFIRQSALATGQFPLVYQVCRENNLRLKDLKRLFPSGYLRGACKLAGLHFSDLNCAELSPSVVRQVSEPVEEKHKTYEVDVRGFLMNPEVWDEQFASFKALELGIRGKLTEKHWQVIRFLRDFHARNGKIPTVYETCENNQLEMEDLEGLFPSGYHRGAVKIAGLRPQ